MTVSAIGPMTSSDSRQRTAYCPAWPAVLRLFDWPIRGAAMPSFVAIVDPPIEDGELEEGDHQGHEEQAHREHRTLPVVLRLLEDLVHHGLGCPAGAALGDDVDLGEG